MNLLELVHIGFVATGKDGRKKRILSDVNLSIQKGDFVAIAGRNGSGKTILAKLIMGIEQPTEGEICFKGENVTGLSVAERAERGMGLAFQQPIKFTGLSVQDLLRLSARKRLTVESMGEYLTRVGLEGGDYLERELDGKLSGGEMKRIEIAVLLARDADLLIFDEPESGIDLWAFEKLVMVFEELRKGKQKTIIVISHREEILELADSVVTMNGGRLC